MPLLEVRNISVAFGGLRALDRVSFTVSAGTVHGVIGPNGAGKTTLFNCISRLLDPTEGNVRFDGQDLLKVPPHKVVSLGLARTFQNLEVCRFLPVIDNVLMGAYHRDRIPALAYALRLPAAGRAEAAARAEALQLLDRVGCSPYAPVPAGGLPYGVLKRVELARALACKPRLLILDEPAAGLTATDRLVLADLVRQLKAEGMTVLLVEHDMSLVMSLCDQVTVLDFGRVIADGSPEVVQSDPDVIAAYLGIEEEEVAASAQA